jgi:hypothetical protein
MGRKPKTDPGAAEQVQDEGVAARNQKESHPLAENEDLVKQRGREAAAGLDTTEGEQLEEAVRAAQRGRTA